MKKEFLLAAHLCIFIANGRGAGGTRAPGGAGTVEDVDAVDLFENKDGDYWAAARFTTIFARLRVVVQHFDEIPQFFHYFTYLLNLNNSFCSYNMNEGG